LQPPSDKQWPFRLFPQQRMLSYIVLDKHFDVYCLGT
jgi:hypothetical protein